MNTNHRKYPRYEVQVNVTLNFNAMEPRQLSTRDISEGGMFIETEHASTYPLGEMVHVSYKNPLKDNHDTATEAIVVRVADDGIAIAFIEMDTF